MFPFGNQRVTLIQRLEVIINGKSEIKFVRHILNGCSWSACDIWRNVGAEMQRASEVVCKIPLGNVVPSTGDYLFLGYMQDLVEDVRSLNKAIDKHREEGGMRVASVSNRALAGMPLPHITARGESA